MSTGLEADFAAAVSLYRIALYRADLPDSAREAAAVEFRTQVPRWHAAGLPGLTLLDAQLASAEAERRNTAARLLVELPDRRATERLLAAFTRPGAPQLDAGHLRRLGRAAPLTEDLWQKLPALHPWERPALLQALLRSPSERGREAFQRTLAEGDPFLAGALVSAVAGWREPRLLWSVVRGSWSRPVDLPPLLVVDVRLEAALHLGLAGDEEAVIFLAGQASGQDPAQAAHASIRLAWLAWPDGIGPTRDLIGNEDAGVTELGINTAAVLRAAALGPALLDLAEGPAPQAPDVPSLAASALAVVAELTGEEWAEVAEQRGIERERIIDRYRQALTSLDPGRRYVRGEPLTLGHLAAELLSPHTGTVQAAAYNLRAITGQDYGLDPNDDLIGNVSAIAAWREHAHLPGPTEPGGWAFGGQSLPDPELPQ